MAKFIPNSILSAYAAITNLNGNFTTIADLFDRVLFRDGTSPNSMSADIDMNHYNVQNVADAVTDTDAPNLGQVSTMINNITGIGVNGSGDVTITGSITVPDNNQFYSENGAYVARLGDRVFIGAARSHNATNVASQPDWLTTYELGAGRSFGALHLAQTGNLAQAGVSNAFVTASRTTGLPATNYNAIGLWSTGVSDVGSGTGMAWGAYFEGYRKNAGSPGAYGIEADVINFVGEDASDPYIQSNNQTVGVQVASGGDYTPASLFNATAAFTVRYNGAAFLAGMTFGSDAIKLVSGVGEAIQLASGHSLQWYAATGNKTNAIFSQTTDSTKAINIKLNDDFVRFQDASTTKHAFLIEKTAGAVNFLGTKNQGTGSSPILAAYGDDTNVGIRLQPQGTARILIPISNVPNYTDDTAAATGGVQIGEIYRNGSVLMIRAA